MFLLLAIIIRVLLVLVFLVLLLLQLPRCDGVSVVLLLWCRSEAFVPDGERQAASRSAW